MQVFLCSDGTSTGMWWANLNYEGLDGENLNLSTTGKSAPDALRGLADVIEREQGRRKEHRWPEAGCDFGKVSGTVIDPSGAVLPNVPVKLVCTEMSPFETTTAEDGSFEFSVPAPYRYLLRCPVPGFEEALILDIAVMPEGNYPMTVAITLPPAAYEEVKG